MEIDPPPVGVFEPPTPKSNRLFESSLFMFMVIDCFVADYVEISCDLWSTDVLWKLRVLQIVCVE